MMDIRDILEIIGWIFGTGGAFSLIAYFRQNKELKEAEVKLAAANVKLADAQAESTIADNYEKLVNRLESTIEAQDKRLAQSDEFHEKRYQDLKKMQENNTDEISQLKKKINEDKPFICYDMTCQLRKKQK